jgi:hypothetical protein
MKLIHGALAAVALSGLGACATMAPAAQAQSMVSTAPYLAQGLVRVQSRFGFDETVARIRADVASKDIREFAVVPQSALAHDAQIDLRPSTLIISVIRRSARNSSPRIPMQAWIGRCACWSIRM